MRILKENLILIIEFIAVPLYFYLTYLLITVDPLPDAVVVFLSLDFFTIIFAPIIIKIVRKILKKKAMNKKVAFDIKKVTFVEVETSDELEKLYNSNALVFVDYQPTEADMKSIFTFLKYNDYLVKDGMTAYVFSGQQIIDKFNCDAINESCPFIAVNIQDLQNYNNDKFQKEAKKNSAKWLKTLVDEAVERTQQKANKLAEKEEKLAEKEEKKKVKALKDDPDEVDKILNNN